MNMSVTSKMSTNCGMKNMHQSSSTNAVQAANTNTATPNIGKTIDAKV